MQYGKYEHIEADDTDSDINMYRLSMSNGVLLVNKQFSGSECIYSDSKYNKFQYMKDSRCGMNILLIL